MQIRQAMVPDEEIEDSYEVVTAYLTSQIAPQAEAEKKVKEWLK